MRETRCISAAGIDNPGFFLYDLDMATDGDPHKGYGREANTGGSMKLTIDPGGVWYHGSNRIFTELREGSTVTQWKELAEAFSHQPTSLWYDDDGVIGHNGTEKGHLYIIDEPVAVGTDVYQHPRTTMDENAEFLTKRPLKVKMIREL